MKYTALILTVKTLIVMSLYAWSRKRYVWHRIALLWLVKSLVWQHGGIGWHGSILAEMANQFLFLSCVLYKKSGKGRSLGIINHNRITKCTWKLKGSNQSFLHNSAFQENVLWPLYYAFFQFLRTWRSSQMNNKTIIKNYSQKNEFH